MLDFKYPLRTGNMMMCYKERHPLPLKYFITFLGSIRKAGEASHIILKPLVLIHTRSFLPGFTFKFPITCPIWGTLSAMEMGCCAARRGTHCC